MSETARPARLKLSADVLHETIDGEVIVIDLTTGTYYSLRGTAAEVWELVKQSPGMSLGELTEALVVRYTRNGHNVEGAVVSFVAQLRDEGLVVTDKTATGTTVVPVVEPSAGTAHEFTAPVLDKYTDMQDLVLIDPVHDVSQAGWPHLPSTAADSSRA
jgi:Coenzyme PQQ synthesis protein D (PqqD)